MKRKIKSPQIGATTQRAVYISRKKDRANGCQINQAPKHIIFFLLIAMELIVKNSLLRGTHE